MELYIAGGVGEHGRNSFYVRGTKSSFLVDCGVMTNDPETPYPHLSQEQINVIDTVFLTHSHADHTAALPWLYEQGFCGQVIASKETLQQLPFDLSESVSLEEICPNREGQLNALSIVWGRSGHCPGSVWYQFTEDEKSILLSGDYTEDTQIYTCDRIRGQTADIAILDCAYGMDKTSYEFACHRLINRVKELLDAFGLLLFPVPKFGRGLELLKLFSDNLSGVNYFADEVLLSQLEALKQDTFWSLPVNMDAAPHLFKGEVHGIVFVSSPQLHTKASQETAKEVLTLGGRAVMTGTVEEGSFSAMLIAEKMTEFLRYPVHLNYFQYQHLVQENRFAKTIPYHSTDFPKQQEIYYL